MSNVAVKLTTLTPVWGRESMLRGWVKAIKGASIPEVEHWVMFVGENPPVWWGAETEGSQILTLIFQDAPTDLSIGHWHNFGAKSTTTDTEWIMKLDIDTIPNVRFFKELLPILETAKPREWFNAGMVYANQAVSAHWLSDDKLPVSESTHRALVGDDCKPEATNFICRREDYLKLGGCDPRFKGWGWEDYQQIYMLESFQRQAPALNGPLSLTNAARHCRDEISRPKALELYQRNPWLVLLHRWHPKYGPGTAAAEEYRSHSERNRRVLFDYIQEHRSKA